MGDIFFSTKDDINNRHLRAKSQPFRAHLNGPYKDKIIPSVTSMNKQQQNEIQTSLTQRSDIVASATRGCDKIPSSDGTNRIKSLLSRLV